MTDFNFSQYQEFLKPISNLVSGIVRIVGYENKAEEKEKSEELISQIFLSVTIMHLSQQSKGVDMPDLEEIKELIAQNKKDEIEKIFATGITEKLLTKYLEESSTIVMTNYYFEVKDRMTPEKTEEIKQLYNQIQERS